MAGRLEVIVGCMFSGKSEELIRRLRRASIAGQKVACYKPVIDDRYSDRHAVSHSGDQWESIGVSTAEELFQLANGTDAEVIGIEEAQFLGDQLPEACRKLVQQGRRVICAGLDLDCFNRPFHPMPELLCEAEQVDKLSAVCMVCRGDATRSQLLVDGSPAPYQDEVLLTIGAAEQYEARCRHCHRVPEPN